MGTIPHYPKIWHLGNDAIEHLFVGSVEITEKIDGSMFGFGVNQEGDIVIRSKGKQMYLESYEHMFEIAVQQVEKRRDRLIEIYNSVGPFFVYGEFLSKPKHNILCYDRVPKDNIIVFGVKLGQNFAKDYHILKNFSDGLGLETVPVLYNGVVGPGSHEELKKMIHDTPSVLGNTTVEGIVIKNYWQIVSVGSLADPCFGKYVREDFKERLHKEFKTGKNKEDEFIDSFRNEAIWHKAVQHLEEKGELEHSPRDIGKLMKAIPEDVLEENKPEIEKFAFNNLWAKIRRKCIAGFPEFYKEYLLKRQFENE